MIAVNPLAKIDIYGADKMQPYSKKELGDPRVESHLYAMGEAAYWTLLRSQSSAALVMSGESGVGKTDGKAPHELHRMVLRKCRRRFQRGDRAEAGEHDHRVKLPARSLWQREDRPQQQLVAFGKMMRLHFKPNGEMAGAFIKTYLLEKIRCVAITSPERNYHVFYQLLAARPEPAGQGHRLDDTAVAQYAEQVVMHSDRRRRRH